MGKKDKREEIHIVKTEYGMYMCTAIIKGEKYSKVCDDIILATAWAESVADYSLKV